MKTVLPQDELRLKSQLFFYFVTSLALLPSQPPVQVDLKLSARGQKGRGGGKEKDQVKRKSVGGGGGGHAFSATNPYGQRAAGDRRQFTH